MSSPFLSAAACAAAAARRVGVRIRDRSSRRARPGRQRRAPGGITAQCRGPARWISRIDGDRDEPVDRATRRPGGARMSLDETSSRGIDSRSNRQPGPGGSACASPARSITTIVARSRVSSSRRHVGMFATASAPSSKNSSRPGAASASSVSAVTDGPVAFDLDRPTPRRPSTPATAASTSAEPVGGPTRRPGPRFCHGSPATTSRTRSRLQRPAGLGGGDEVPDVHRVEGAAEHARCAPPPRTGV